MKDRPSPTRWSVAYWKAFQDLTSSRNWTTGGPTEISYIAKLAWLNENGISDPDDRDEYLTVIQTLDIEYIKQLNDSK